MKKNRQQLTTLEYNNLDKDIPLKEYPRPQLKRDSYINLDGLWDYKISDNDDITNISFDGQILVSYCLESLNSQVQKELKEGQYLIYHRHFKLSSEFIKEITLLNLLGVDQEFDLVINNRKYGHFISYLCPVSIDISDSILEENEIFIIVKDDLKACYPHGKQVRKSRGMFYTSVSGLYFPLFLESVNKNYIKNIKITPYLSAIDLYIDSLAKTFEITIFKENKIVKKIITDKHELHIEIDNPILWELDNPFLYDIVIKTEDDEISSYFGLRTISTSKNKVLLNNHPIFLNGLLNQGYYPEGIYTVSTYDNYKQDILTMKEIGFNLLRVHEKIEADYFYYLCDKLGMLVLQDFVFTGNYSFFHDTALPTIGFQKLDDTKKKMTLYEKKSFLIHSKKVINHLFNHPCIIGYTIFNEGWGQFSGDRIYNYLKPLDKTRLYDATSGWFRQNNSDFESLHIYFKKIDKQIKDSSKPLLISEFGGYVYKINEHSFNLDKTYGYKFFKTPESFEQGLISLYRDQILPHASELCGCIYTQVSDVEDETNGLFTYDRKILKINKNVLKETFKDINNNFNSN